MTRQGRDLVSDLGFQAVDFVLQMWLFRAQRSPSVQICAT